MMNEDFETLYSIVAFDGLGNTLFSDNRERFLKEIRKVLLAKYGSLDYRVKFLSICLIKAETGEFDIQDKEWLRYILHAESEPNDAHESELESLKEQIENSELGDKKE